MTLADPDSNASHTAATSPFAVLSRHPALSGAFPASSLLPSAGPAQSACHSAQSTASGVKAQLAGHPKQRHRKPQNPVGFKPYVRPAPKPAAEAPDLDGPLQKLLEVSRYNLQRLSIEIQAHSGPGLLEEGSSLQCRSFTF